MPLYPPQLQYSFVPPDNTGMLAASFPPWATVGSTIMPTAGLLTFVKVRLPTEASVTNVILTLATAGATLTANQCLAGLYNSARALIGTTADQSTNWAGATGRQQMALTGGPFTCTAGIYFVAFYYNGTTAPTWTRAGATSTSILNSGLSSPNILCGTADSGLTTSLPSTMGAQTGAGTFWWAGLS